MNNGVFNYKDLTPEAKKTFDSIPDHLVYRDSGPIRYEDLTPEARRSFDSIEEVLKRKSD